MQGMFLGLQHLGQYLYLRAPPPRHFHFPCFGEGVRLCVGMWLALVEAGTASVGIFKQIEAFAPGHACFPPCLSIPPVLALIEESMYAARRQG